jgi:hypothetical protein
MKNWQVLRTFGPNSQGGWEAVVALGYVPGRWAMAAGWGYDDDMPLRPWPQYLKKTLPKSGGLYRVLGISGFFISIGTL